MRTACGCGGLRHLFSWNVGLLAPQKQWRQCCICYEQFEFDMGVSCGNGHFVCDGCFTQYIAFKSRMANDDIDDIRKRRACIFCPCHGTAAGNCTSEPFSDARISKHAADYASQLYFSSKERFAQQQIEEMNLQLHLQDAERQNHFPKQWRVISESMSRRLKMQRLEAGRNLLADQLRAQFPNAFQCSRCSFGPIDFNGCNDLAAHHEQAMLGGALVRNSCPRCGWFAQSIRDWPRWNGHVPDAAVQEDCITAGVQLAYSRELRAALCGVLWGISWATRGLWPVSIVAGMISHAIWEAHLVLCDLGATISLALAPSAHDFLLMAKWLAPAILECIVVASLSVQLAGWLLPSKKPLRSQR